MISESWCLFSLFYLLVTVCFVFRTKEFVSAGVTVESLLGSWITSEHENFILHHIQRTSLTLLVHSLLPLVYVSTLLFLIDDTPPWLFTSTYLGLTFAALSIITPTVVLTLLYSWTKDGYSNHPIARKMSVFCDTVTSWRTLSSDINAEFKRVDKINLQCSSINKVIATDNWIIKTGPYTLWLAHQSDSVLILVSADTHDVSVSGTANNGTVQYLSIEVKTTRRNAENFFIRCNALDFKDLEEKIRRPITILPDVTFHRSRTDLFLEVFRNAVAQNRTTTSSQELEMCIGCMIVQSNVKLVKHCEDTTSTDRSCTTCYCRPLWCIDCMGKWWVSRQEQDQPETWLSSKCTCPVCRSVFCMQDICPVVFTNS
ncbi:transmembrane protein 129 [Nilaparvata lugens]|uniref:transmembrane protein 129 n=1 Tax=Nilaparvata lugens TaxID=108931 RepID=UPI00193E5A3B|nr:transmembrane protein 129 [Nilaparvata lugens]